MRKTRSTLKIIEPKELKLMPPIVVEQAVENTIPGPSHEPQPLAAIVFVEGLPPTPKAKKRKTPAFFFTLPRKRTRSARSTATTFTAPVVTANTSTSSPVEPTTNQNPPLATTTVQAPTFTANESSQKKKNVKPKENLREASTKLHQK